MHIGKTIPHSEFRIMRVVRTVSVVCLAIALIPVGTRAQEAGDPTLLRSHATLFGVGYHNLLDTYLSPLEYTGTEVRILREHARLTHLMNDRVAYQNTLQGYIAYCKSPTDDAKTISGMVDWTFAWRYQWQPSESLTLQAGPAIGTHLGFAYNTRNGNNPAQARIAVDAGLSAAASYRFQCLGKSFTARYQADLPLVGAMFSPNYTQSYYEIFSLGNYDHNICATHLFQAFNISQMLSLDMPLGNHTIRLGYLCNIRQSHVNHLKSHDWSHAFMLGYVKQFQLIKPNRKQP